MSEIIECPYCTEGGYVTELNCCREPTYYDSGSSPECCGIPIPSVVKCEVCEGTSEITKQRLMEMKLKGYEPYPELDMEDEYSKVLLALETVENN